MKSEVRQRLMALFFLLAFVAGTLTPTAPAFAAERAPKHKSVGPIAAQEATTRVSPLVEELAPVSQAVANQGAKEQQKEKPDLRKVKKKREKEDKRTLQSRTFELEGDGELTETTAVAQNYKDEDGKFKPINDRPERDAKYEQKHKIPESFWERIWPGSPQPVGYKAVEGDLEVYFETLNQGDQGGIRVIANGEELRFAPDTDKTIKPQLKEFDDGRPYIFYEDVWPGVDVYYAYRGSALKEYIRLNGKTSQSSFGFKLEGAKVVQDEDGKIVFDGKFADVLVLGELSVNVNQQGPVKEGLPKYVVRDGGRTLAVELDKGWLSKQDKDAFPMVIDPAIYDYTDIPGGYYGQFWPYKSDGYQCPNTSCNINIGALNDNGLKSWRTMFVTPYEHIFGRQILGAQLTMTMTNDAGWAGYYEGRTVWVTWAPCFGYGCIHGGAPEVAGTVGADGAIDVTALMQWLQNNNVHGGVLIAWGEEWHSGSYKQIHPLSVRLHTWTNRYPGTPVPEVPSNNPNTEVVITTTQPTLGVSSVGDPDGATVKYRYQVRTTNGTVLYQTDRLTTNRLTIPDGFLQDGVSYLWSYTVSDDYWESGWHNGGKFKVDLRTDKDKASTFATTGPVSVNLNNGNVYTSVNSHGIQALDGTIGLSLEYNSPYVSRKGLRASYYNNQTWSGKPVLVRTEATVDNNWGLGSPAHGVVQDDSFSARYEGFFVAPTTGTYYFGGSNDDNLRITVNNQQIYNNGGCYSGICYGSAVSLTEGQAVPILIEYIEGTWTAYARVFVKGAVSQQVLPSDWLRTAPMPTEHNTGLIGHYYADNGSHDFANSPKIMTRRDSAINFEWGSTAPVPGLQADNFLVRWEGYFTPPVTGAYTLGARADDGVRIKINNSTVMQNWAAGAFPLIYGSSVMLTAGNPVPITVEYFEVNSGAYIQLYAKMPNNPNGGIVEPQYLSPGGKVLPAGWNISADADGSLAYERLEVRQNGDVIMYDADSSTQLFTNTGSGFKPPVNEDATLVRNADGTYSLTATDGRVYVFNVDGTLRQTQAPLDDLKPAALKYNYATQNGIPKLVEIIDGVDPSRKGNLYYQGDSQCASPSGGFVVPPTSNLCAFVTSDGQRTDFFYTQDSNGNKHLARVSLPGGAKYDLGYDDNGVLSSVRDVLANDAVGTGLRSDDESVLTQISYDALYRAVGVRAPAPTAGVARQTHTLEYLQNKSKLHETGAAEPNGYTQYVEYDNLYRTTKACDKAALCTTAQWDSVKDFVLSTTDAIGLKSTTLYNDEDRPTDAYGPAPVEWFGADRKPLTQYAAQVPHTQTKYDEGVTGLAVAYYAYNASSKTLTGAPKLHTTNLGGPAGTITRDWGTAPPIAGATEWGFRATGTMRLPLNGNYRFRIGSDSGVRMWIDDKLVINDWNDGFIRDHADYIFNNVANSVHRVQIDFYHRPNASANTFFSLKLMPPGQSETTSIASWFSPSYGLVTSAKVFDSQIGDATSVTSYGNKPELGQAQSATVDPTGLNLSTSFAYEPYQTGSLMRQTSKTLPGGTTTNYTYYNATETRDNPCTPETEAYRQAGFMKQKTEADPDGTGPRTPRTSEIVYDDTGRTVASRFNNDPWTCATYDDRGRVVKTVVPTINGRPGRTVTTHYNYQGNPLKTQVVDSVAGTTVSEIDLLGRTISATDQFGNVSTATYDSQGRLVSKTTPLGTEGYTYDTYDRVIEYKLGDTKYATITYDQYSRAQDITYDQAKDANNKLKLEQIKRDALQRTSGAVFRFSDGTAFDETVTLSQAGKVTAYTDTFGGNSVTNTYTYDKAGRLTAASIDGNTYSYGYGTTTGCAGSFNPNAHKNSNRTSFTVNGVTTTYCYNQADQLISSTDAQLGTPTYDDHGNTTQLSGSGTPITFVYDATDSNIAIQQGDYKVEYVKTASGSVLRKKEYQNNELAKSYRYLAGGAVLQTCNPTNDNDCVTTDTYLGLPGGVTLTIPASTGPTSPPEPPQSTTDLPSPWLATRFGPAYQQGSASYSNGVFTLTSSGNDIWDDLDEAQVVTTTLSGDGQIVARVTGHTNTQAWAKAGLIIKNTLKSKAKYQAIMVTPGNGIRMEGNYNTDIYGGSYSFPNIWLKLVRNGNTVTTYKSTNGTNWAQVGSASYNFRKTVQIGLFTLSGDDSYVTTATFDNVTVTPSIPSTLPEGWANGDTGNPPSPAGTSNYNNGVFTLTGRSSDVWDDEDQAQRAYRTMKGDGQIVARVTSQTNSDGWGKAGVFIKASPADFSHYVSIHRTPSHGTQMEWNYDDGEDTSGLSLPNAWYKLVRTGNTIKGYKSSNGVNWTHVDTTTDNSLPETVMIGLLLVSGDTSKTATATFDNVTITPDNPAPPVNPPTQPTAPVSNITYSIKNFHGDTAITAGADGKPTSSVYLYEPFGMAAPSATFGTSSNPTNATDESMGWAANPTRKVAGSFTVPIIQMGARVYLPTAGRFLQVDPVEGGTLNAYVYAHDPVNMEDYSGLFLVRGIELLRQAVTRATPYIQKAINNVKSTLKTAPIVPTATELAKGAEQARKLASENKLTYTETAARHLSGRPYMNSNLLIQEIMKTKPMADPQGAAGTVMWRAFGTNWNIQGKAPYWSLTEPQVGFYELLVHPESGKIYHFLFKPLK